MVPFFRKSLKLVCASLLTSSFALLQASSAPQVQNGDSGRKHALGNSRQHQIHLVDLAAKFEAEQLQYEVLQQRAEQLQINSEVLQQKFEQKQHRFEVLQIQAESEGRGQDAQYFLQQAKASRRDALAHRDQAKIYLEEAQADRKFAQQRRVYAEAARERAKVLHEAGEAHGREAAQCTSLPGDAKACQLQAKAKQSDAYHRESGQRAVAAGFEGDPSSVEYWENQGSFWLSQSQKFANQLQVHLFLKVALPVGIVAFVFGLLSGFIFLVKCCHTSDGRFDPLRGHLGDVVRWLAENEDRLGDLLEEIGEINKQSSSPQAATWALIQSLTPFLISRVKIKLDDWLDPGHYASGSSGSQEDPSSPDKPDSKAKE